MLRSIVGPVVGLPGAALHYELRDSSTYLTVVIPGVAWTELLEVAGQQHAVFHRDAEAQRAELGGKLCALRQMDALAIHDGHDLQLPAQRCNIAP